MDIIFVITIVDLSEELKYYKFLFSLIFLNFCWFKDYAI